MEYTSSVYTIPEPTYQFVALSSYNFQTIGVKEYTNRLNFKNIQFNWRNFKSLAFVVPELNVFAEVMTSSTQLVTLIKNIYTIWEMLPSVCYIYMHMNILMGYRY